MACETVFPLFSLRGKKRAPAGQFSKSCVATLPMKAGVALACLWLALHMHLTETPDDYTR